MTTRAAPVCLNPGCKHFHRGNYTRLACDAFPDRIPDEILLYGNPHTEPVEGDHGIRFEPVEGK